MAVYDVDLVTNSAALQRFQDSIDSPATRKQYTLALRSYKEHFLYEDYDQMLLEAPKKIQSDLIHYVEYKRKRDARPKLLRSITTSLRSSTFTG